MPRSAPGSPFARLLHLSDWLWARTAATHRLTPEQLVDHLADYLLTESGADPAEVEQALLDDYVASGARARPQRLRARLAPGATPVRARRETLAQRQQQHLAHMPGEVAPGASQAVGAVEIRL